MTLKLINDPSFLVSERMFISFNTLNADSIEYEFKEDITPY
jgi:hypothetical protein